jgi:hypothetical protein
MENKRRGNIDNIKMMNEITHTALAGIFFACSEKKQRILEHIVPEHILTHAYTGKISVTTADKTYSFSAGQTVLFARNQLAKLVKEPDGETVCKSVSIFFTQPFLQQFYATKPLSNEKTKNLSIVELDAHPLLDDLFQSIETYSALGDNWMTNDLAQLKLKEALTIIRQLNKNVDILLSDFSEPHKPIWMPVLRTFRILPTPLSNFSVTIHLLFLSL